MPKPNLSIDPPPFLSSDIAVRSDQNHSSSSSSPSSISSSDNFSFRQSTDSSISNSFSSSARRPSPPPFHRAFSAPVVHSTSLPASPSPSPFPDLAALQFSEDLSPAQHVTLGVRLYETNQLEQAAYHLQEAAHANHIPAMIIYALYLRHGWGTRPDPHQSTAWLSRAADILCRRSNSIVDVADIPPSPSTATCHSSSDDAASSRGMILNSPLCSPRWKMPLSVAARQLGKSYSSKQGDRNEVMAMACFEIGAHLGDSQSMCAAAELWTKSGLGRKKDLYKAASLYRQAADLGLNTPQTQWIYKDKYKRFPDIETAEASKRRSFFSRFGGKRKAST
ncbi:hypothetical protein BZA70DRAFT_277353 [Myxozyma melibiosi]|uniref:Uncharacterized protein n=1 Tax=Myxozyma melibiosi TaxID=54550 RepID=A0ABR1F7T2_9ASCO